MLERCFTRPGSRLLAAPVRSRFITSRPVLSYQRYRWSSSSSAFTRPTIASLLDVVDASESNEPVVAHGFVRSVRRHKRVCFAVIGDGSTIKPLQVVLSPSQAQGLTNGIAVTVSGQWKRSIPGSKQSHEIHAETVKTLGSLDSTTYPLQKKFHTAEYLRTIPHLRLRTTSNALLLRLRSHSIAQLTEFLAGHDFIQTHTPIITSSDCEGAGEVFTVGGGAARASLDDTSLENSARVLPFFRDPKYLTVSSQLHLEAMAQSVSRVWTLSPTFRAERSETARHLSEFYMLEAEISFSNNLEEIMSLLEGLLRDLSLSLQESRLGEELLLHQRSMDADEEDASSIDHDALQRRWKALANGPWPRVTYTEAVTRLMQAVESKEVNFKFTPDWSSGLQAEHERFLAQVVGNDGPVFVTDYPRHLKPFYMPPSPEGSSPTPGPTVSCFDLLLPDVCEIAGGSMREHRMEELLYSMRENGLIKPKEGDDELSADMTEISAEQLGGLGWYVDLRRWGSVPHGGFGLGFDRLLTYLSGVSN
ncbi:MAG: hypothetical protein M4579_006637, partial [Chaenotheca gracillima]